MAPRGLCSERAPCLLLNRSLSQFGGKLETATGVVEVGHRRAEEQSGNSEAADDSSGQNGQLSHATRTRGSTSVHRVTFRP